MQTRTLA